MWKKETFDVLLLISRPAAGKSEIIAYLKKIDISERIERFQVGKFEVIDDFPMLWMWFEEDRILTEMGHPRLHTDKDGMFIDQHLWDLLIKRVCLEYRKNTREIPDYQDKYSTIIEFSRGKEHDGYARAFSHLTQELIGNLAIMYINVSWEESFRKNRTRYNPNRPDSILEHGLPDNKMEILYKEIDWEEVSAADPLFITIQGIQVPYVVFENEDDVTTERGDALGKRLEKTLSRLWNLYRARKRDEID